MSVRNQILSIKSVHSLSIENISIFVLLSYIFTDSDEKKEDATSNVKVSKEHCSTI